MDARAVAAVARTTARSTAGSTARGKALGAVLGVATMTALGSLAGCGTEPVDCIAVSASVPTVAAPGEQVEVTLADVLPGCNVHGSAARPGSDAVELKLVAVDTSQQILATGTAAVTAAGTAVVTLTIPRDASGHVSVELDGVSLGTLKVTP